MDRVEGNLDLKEIQARFSPKFSQKRVHFFSTQTNTTGEYWLIYVRVYLALAEKKKCGEGMRRDYISPCKSFHLLFRYITPSVPKRIMTIQIKVKTCFNKTQLFKINFCAGFVIFFSLMALVCDAFNMIGVFNFTSMNINHEMRKGLDCNNVFH